VKRQFDCPDAECAGECSMDDLPVVLRPYWCNHVTDAMRRVRDLVAAELDL